MSRLAAIREKLAGAVTPVPGVSPVTRRLALTAGLTLLPFSAFAGFSGNPGLLVTTALPAGAMLFFARFAGRTVPALRQAARIKAEAFEYIIDHMRDATLQFDEDGKLVFGSRPSAGILGCEKYELAGQGLMERTHVADRPLLMTAMADARSGGKERLIEVRMRRDSGNPSKAAPEFIWIEANLFPMKSHGEQSGPFGVIMTMRDISLRKDNEREMQKARQEAEEASRAKNQFLAVIGHELRTPLNAIVGFSDMMRSGIGGKLDPAHEEYAQLINQSGHHLLEMVNMLLDMSKIEAGRFEVQTELFEPEKLIAPCMQIVSKAAREKNVSIEVELSRNVPEIVGDERACRQIAINLLSNAVKFSQPGSRVVWSIKRQGKQLRMSFTDSGIGMSRDVLERLGEPFFQAQSTADRRYEGTGLGISIVKGLVELHDGSVNISSQEGVGTTVTILLPINGPETKTGDGAAVTPIHGEAETEQAAEWVQPKQVAQ